MEFIIKINPTSLNNCAVIHDSVTNLTKPVSFIQQCLFKFVQFNPITW